MGKNKKQHPPTTAAASALQLSIIHPNAVGIDVGAMSMMLSYSSAEGHQIVKEYDAYTGDLRQMATELGQSGVTHVGIDATGFYLTAVNEILDQYRHMVILGN